MNDLFVKINLSPCHCFVSACWFDLMITILQIVYFLFPSISLWKVNVVMKHHAYRKVMTRK